MKRSNEAAKTGSAAIINPKKSSLRAISLGFTLVLMLQAGSPLLAGDFPTPDLPVRATMLENLRPAFRPAPRMESAMESENVTDTRFAPDSGVRTGMRTGVYGGIRSGVRSGVRSGLRVPSGGSRIAYNRSGRRVRR